MIGFVASSNPEAVEHMSTCLQRVKGALAAGRRQQVVGTEVVLLVAHRHQQVNGRLGRLRRRELAQHSLQPLQKLLRAVSQ